MVATINVQSGPVAGSQEATGPKVDCNISPTGSGATYLDVEKSPGLYTMTFISAEGGAGPKAIYFQALFDQDLENLSADKPSIEVSTLDPTGPRGSGTAHLEDKGSTIKWTLTGTSEDGVGFTATIECGPVDRR